jgi:hypothetical protein
MSFLSRYQQGEHFAVWAELNALGEDVRARKIRDDAYAVASETMRRARVNIQTLAGDRPDCFRPPAKRTADRLKAFEKQLQGKLPFSLHAWWMHVGEVALPGLVVFALDPACIFKPDPPFFPPRRAWETSVEAWRRTLLAGGKTPEETEAELATAIAEFEAQDEEYDALADIPFDPRCRHPLTPDDLAIAGIKRGTCNVLLPQPTADFPLENAEGAPFFVPWLRQYFRDAGDGRLLPL